MGQEAGTDTVTCSVPGPATTMLGLSRANEANPGGAVYPIPRWRPPKGALIRLSQRGRRGARLSPADNPQQLGPVPVISARPPGQTR